MARLLYTIVFYLLLPFILLRLLLRARKAPDYAKRWLERFAFFTKPRLKDEVLWVHAVSVGESLAAVPLIKLLLEKNPAVSIVVTCTTPTGSDRIRDAFSSYSNDQIFHVYCPYDLPGSLRRFCKRIKPKALIIMETELWPNTVALCNQGNIPVILANGRLSQRSAKRYRLISWLMKPVFKNIIAAVQSNADGERMQGLGLPQEQCHITGSIKFDLTIDDDLRAKAKQLKQRINSPSQTNIFIAASTHEGEEGPILEAFKIIKQQHEKSFLILVPRHPERFDAVADMIRPSGFNFNRRSENRIEVESDVLLGDTMGELLLLLGAADAAFIGGSLVPVGGHNLMEPAAWALPIMTGPHLFNFSQVSELLLDAEALSIVETENEIADKIIELWKDEEGRVEKGEKALAIANDNRGALEKLIKVIDQTID